MLPPDADEPIETLRARQRAEGAGCARQDQDHVAFSSDGLREPRDFVRNGGRAVHEGLSEDAAIRALTINAAQMAGAPIGRHENKLVVLGALGIEATMPEEAPPQGIADIVVDLHGSESGLTTALQLVRPRGTIVLKTTIAGTQTLSLAPVVVDEITIVGSRCGPFDRALDALANGLVDVHPLISDRFDLDDGVRALERAGEPGVLKVLLSISD